MTRAVDRKTGSCIILGWGQGENGHCGQLCFPDNWLRHVLKANELSVSAGGSTGAIPPRDGRQVGKDLWLSRSRL